MGSSLIIFALNLILCLLFVVRTSVVEIVYLATLWLMGHFIHKPMQRTTFFVQCFERNHNFLEHCCKIDFWSRLGLSRRGYEQQTGNSWWVSS